ncbi:MAG: LL-diaminopimelate aminotransferase [Deltaproteobacteria bacterium]|nr:LL-diaminopimelate aminotransferase [Deltaproteobacteria bacterium]
MTPADRIKNLPPYPFAAIDKAREKARAEGKDIISLGIGDPDLPTPAFIVETLQAAASDPKTHRYPDYTGRLDYRKVCAEFMKRRFGVDFDGATEILALIGSKEGIAHAPLAFLNPGEVALCPDPGYPVYAVATGFVGGLVHRMPLLEENGFTPDLSAIPPDVAAKAKMMFLNYPNNPTGAVVSREFLTKAVDFCIEHDIVLVYDNAYSELAFGGYKPLSIFEIDSARDVAIEMHSLSKTFNMTGWRIGFAAGAAAHVGALGQVKTNVDSGAFDAIQLAAMEALRRYDDAMVLANYDVYGARREACEKKLEDIGIRYLKSPATFYVWCNVPTDETSASFCARVLADTGVVFTPGTAFGDRGEGYFRIALTVREARLLEALDRVEALL